MDIFDDMGVSKLSANVLFKSEPCSDVKENGMHKCIQMSNADSGTMMVTIYTPG